MLPFRAWAPLALVSCAALLLAGCGDSATERENDGQDAGPVARADQAQRVAQEPVRPVAADAEKADPEPAYQGKSLTAWLRQLQDKDKDARIQAAQALAKIDLGEPGGRAVLAALGQALKDKDQTVRFVAAESLRRFRNCFKNSAYNGS